MWALRKYRHYCQGSTTIVVTDHSAILSMLKPTKEFKNRKIANWAVELADYDVIISHRPGRIHFMADLLSRSEKETDPKVLKELFSEIWADVPNVAKSIPITQQSQLYDASVQLERLKRQVAGARLMEEADDEGRMVLTVQGMVEAIASSKRKLREQDSEVYDEYSRIDEFYDMVATSAEEDLSLATILNSQEQDPFCQLMMALLTEGDAEAQLKLCVAEETVRIQEANPNYSHDLVAKEAKKTCELTWRRALDMEHSFTLTAERVIVRLSRRKANKNQKIARELQMMQQIYIPHGDEILQNKIIDHVHMEAAHPRPIRTFQLISQRFVWGRMYARIHDRLKFCTKCQFYQCRPPRAPMMGHTEASRPGEKLALDVIHMPKSKDGYQYALTAIDIYSRFGFLVPLKDIHADTVLTAIRTRILPLGLGKPDSYVIDGGSEFKGVVREAIEAWAAGAHVHAPYRHEAAGNIEVFNKTIEKKMAMLCDKTTDWVKIHVDAVDCYNAEPHEACSDGIHAAISPAELFLGRKLQFSIDKLTSSIEQCADRPATNLEQLQKEAVRMKDFIQQAREQYFKRIESQDKHSKSKLRVFQLNDEVTKFTPTGSKKKNKLSALQDGPYLVVEVGTTGADYKIKRVGANKQAKWVHVDDIRKLKRFLVDDSEQESPAEAKKHSKQFDVQRIVGEKGRTRRAKQFRVMWEDCVETSWEPLAHLKCVEKIADWTALLPEEQRELQNMSDEDLQEAWNDQQAVTVIQTADQAELCVPQSSVPAERNENKIASQGGAVEVAKTDTGSQTTAAQIDKEDSEVNVIMDLMPEPGQMHTMIQRVCKAAGIDIHKVVAVMASPPCETFSLADASNISRGNFYRDHSDPDKPPRSVSSCKTQSDVMKRRMAMRHDVLMKHLVNSVMQDRSRGLSYELIIENPVGSLRQRPYMRGEAWEDLTVRRTVNYCAFGTPYCKHTDFWTTLKSWIPLGVTHNGRCNDGQCGQGKRNIRTGKYNHTEVIAGPSDRKVSGPHYKKTVWQVPKALTEEYLQELIRSRSVPTDSIVLDLFSGGESWRKATEAAGLTYIPVDIKKFAWSKQTETTA
jgi:hypothetical protein